LLENIGFYDIVVGAFVSGFSLRLRDIFSVGYPAGQATVATEAMLILRCKQAIILVSCVGWAPAAFEKTVVVG
jgi:hypothetical protein